MTPSSRSVIHNSSQKLLLFVTSHGRKDLSSLLFINGLLARSPPLLHPIFTPLANYSVSHRAGVPENYLTDTPMNLSPSHLQSSALSERSESALNLSVYHQEHQVSLGLNIAKNFWANIEK